jgi:hypothetical protein
MRKIGWLAIAMLLTGLACQAEPDDVADDDSAPDGDDDDDATAGDDDDATAGDDDDVVTVSAEITSPANLQTFEDGVYIPFEGLAADTAHDVTELTYEWVSHLAGSLGTGTVESDGTAALTIANLDDGYHDITFQVSNPVGEQASDTVRIGICSWQSPETFDTDIAGSGWQLYGDASWDVGGWLEMTGTDRDQQGAVFNLVDTVMPGDVSISFLIRTGPNVGEGADGFAMSVFDVATVAELEDLVLGAANGGGLGYGVSGDYGAAVVDAFHVEIDTWHNVYNGNTEFHTDPTEQNHIAVTLNGDPGDHVLWAAVPDIEDMAWHEVTIDVVEDHVTVTLDGVVVLEGTVPGLWFSGGFIGFSGSTGYYTNYHSFDQLQILQECVVPT